jgi:hypothetical protein
MWPWVGLPQFCGQVVRGHAMTRLTIDDQPHQLTSLNMENFGQLLGANETMPVHFNR